MNRSVLSDKDRTKLMATLTKKSIAAIKKTGHNDRKKPFYEVAEGLPRWHGFQRTNSRRPVPVKFVDAFDSKSNGDMAHPSPRNEAT